MIQKKLCSLLIFTAPIMIDGAENFLSTIGQSDHKEFDTATLDVITFPTTVTGKEFSISTIDFLNNTQVFQFLNNHETLTFNVDGIGKTIPNSLTNQIFFNGDPNTSNNRALIISNNGTTLHSTLSSAEISIITEPGYQIYGPHFFTAEEETNFTALNKGVNHFDVSSLKVGHIRNTQIQFENIFDGTNIDHITLSASNNGINNGAGNKNSIGYVGNSQINILQDLHAGNYLTLSTSNTGEEDSTGSGSNYVGYVGDNQIELDHSWNVENHTMLKISNTGIITSNVAGNNNQIGVISGHQLDQGFSKGSFLGGDFLTFSATNTGINNGAGSGSAGPTSPNLTGIIEGVQYYFRNGFSSGNNTTITCSNTGTVNGSGSYNQTGVVYSNPFFVGSTFTTGSNTHITVSNTGTNTGSGNNNLIGESQNTQIFLGDSALFGDYTTISACNTGTDSGSGNSNYVGCISSGQQIALTGPFTSGEYTNITVSNTGTYTNSGSGNNFIGCITNDQLTCNQLLTLGDNTIIAISNSGTSTSTGASNSENTIGSTNDFNQITTNGFVAGDNLLFTVTNTGIDNGSGKSNNIGVIGYQCTHEGACKIGDNGTITLLNKGVNSNNAALGKIGVLSNHDQFNCIDTFCAGKNLFLTATNSAEGFSSGATVGSCQNQLHFNSPCIIDDGSFISASNEGFGTVTESQIVFEDGFIITSGKATIQASNSIDGSIGKNGILISGSSSGGNATIILENTSLNISSTSPSFTIGALNGDSLSSIESSTDLIIDTDSDVVATFSGNILHIPSLTKRGTGRQTISGLIGSSINTSVEEGTFIFNGYLTGHMDVSSTGTVKGAGGLTGALIINGTIAPGNSIGTLFATTYTQNIGSQYDVEVNGIGESDLIDVSGVAHINGGTLFVSSPDNTYKFQDPYTILQAASREGIYSAVSIISPMIKPTVTYDSQHVYLTLLSNIVSAADSFNELAVAKELDSIVNPTPLQNTLLSELASLSIPEAEKALDSVSGWQYTNQALIAANINSQFLTRLYDPIRFLVTSNTRSPCSNDWTVWTEAGGTLTKMDGNNNAFAVSFNGWETTIGLQKTFLCDWTIGLANSYEQDFIEYKHSGESGNSNTYFAALYGLYRPSYFYTFIDLAYGYSWNQMNRSVNVGPFSYQGQSNPNAYQFTFYGEVGVDIKAKAVLIQPFMGIEAGCYGRSAIKESNVGGWELQVDENKNGLACTRLGMHLTLGNPSGTIGLASLDLSWDRRWTSAQTTIREKFVNFGDDFIIKGVDLDNNSVYYALTLAKCINKNWSLNVKGEGSVWYHAYQFDALFGVSYSW